MNTPQGLVMRGAVDFEMISSTLHPQLDNLKMTAGSNDGQRQGRVRGTTVNYI